MDCLRSRLGRSSFQLLLRRLPAAYGSGGLHGRIVFGIADKADHHLVIRRFAKAHRLAWIRIEWIARRVVESRSHQNARALWQSLRRFWFVGRLPGEVIARHVEQHLAAPV